MILGAPMALGRVLLVVVTVVLLAASCGSDDPEQEASTPTAGATATADATETATPTPTSTQTPTSTATPTATPTPNASAEPTPTEPPPGLIEIEYVVGGVVGGVQRSRVATGEMVELRVRADVTDEVHVHGYDLFAPVAPGSPAVIGFEAGIPGVWEVELEGAGALLVELEVN